MAARLSSTLLRTQTDRRLTTLAAQGSEPALEAIIDRYRRPLQAYCRRLLLDRSSAEDVVQQAFLSTWQTLHDGREITDLRSWLYRVVHNGAVNALRRSGYRHEELSDLLRGDAAPEEDLEKRIAVRRALAGLAELPELQREALLRTAVEGHSHDEVARELGLSAGAVRGLVYRARTTLRSAATALTPMPVIAALATSGGRGGPTAERIAELVAGGGTAGATAVLLKGGATAVTVGALAGGAVVSERALDRPAVAPQAVAADTRGDRGSSADALEPVSTPAVAALAATTKRADRRGDDTGGRDDRSGPGPSGSGTAPAATSDDSSGPSERSGRRGRNRGSDDDDDNSGPSRRSGRRGGDDDDDDDDGRSGNSGPGSGSDDDDDGDSSGSGSGDSGSGGDDDDDVPTTSAPLTAPAPTDGDGDGGGDSSGSGSGGDDEATMTERSAEVAPEAPELDADGDGDGDGDGDSD
jgi:RNA polymerase sigma factor (sigma-70 family)